MKTYKLIANIHHSNEKNRNLNYTQVFQSHVKADDNTQAMRLAVKEVFNKTGFFVSPEKIMLKRV